MHGSIANLPADYSYWAIEESENGTCLVVHSETKDETLFGRKLRLSREIKVSTDQNEFCIRDTIVNTGDKIEPYEILYHMNMGYPLLDEDSVIEILSAEVLPRNEHAASELAKWMHMQRPTAGYEECCYYHKFADKEGRAKIYQPKLGCSLEITFDAEKLDGFVEWKMMGVRDYVLGLECGNCYPDGRDVMRKEGMLKFLSPGQSQAYEVHIRLRDE